MNSSLFYHFHFIHSLMFVFTVYAHHYPTSMSVYARYQQVALEKHTSPLRKGLWEM